VNNQWQYYIIKALEEEKAQLAAGGPIEIPDLVDIQSRTIMKNEYQHDANRMDGGPVPAQHVLCPSRAKGSPYVQSSVYTTPDGYHGSGMQAGTMSHYEYGENLFIYAGSQTKHTSQSDADTGLPILMPYSVAADGRFPWRWGQHNLKPGTWQRVDTQTQWLVGGDQAGNFDTYEPVDISSKGSKGSSGPADMKLTENPGFSCENVGSKAFYILFSGITLVADNGTTRVVDDFSYAKDTPEAWGSGSSWVYPNGSSTPVLRLDCPPNATTAIWRPGGTHGSSAGGKVPPLNISFEFDDWPYMRHSFFVDPAFVVNATVGYDQSEAGGGYAVSEYLSSGIPFRFIGVGWPRADTEYAEYNAPTSEFTARFDNYTASNNAHNDSGGGWGAAGYGGWTRETRWTRRMVLTQEGALVVLDSLETSEQDGGGWLGGPLWQMNLASNCTACLHTGNCTDVQGQQPAPAQCNLTASEASGDWFDLSGFEITTGEIERFRGMLPPQLNLVAKLGGGSGQTHGVTPGYSALRPPP
jgi:hypothetical protein